MSSAIPAVFAFVAAAKPTGSKTIASEVCGPEISRALKDCLGMGYVVSIDWMRPSMVGDLLAGQKYDRSLDDLTIDHGVEIVAGDRWIEASHLRTIQNEESSISSPLAAG
jgi:hypothetical protein